MHFSGSCHRQHWIDLIISPWESWKTQPLWANQRKVLALESWAGRAYSWSSQKCMTRPVPAAALLVPPDSQGSMCCHCTQQPGRPEGGIYIFFIAGSEKLPLKGEVFLYASSWSWPQKSVSFEMLLAPGCLGWSCCSLRNATEHKGKEAKEALLSAFKPTKYPW